MNQKNSVFSRYEHPLVLGHRGVPKEHQENTLAGFKHAAELQLDGVELDVFLTRDNHLVVYHDMNTQRLTGFNGRIEDMSWEQLRALDIHQSICVGNKVINYRKTEKIALLEEVLEEIGNKLIVIAEIKADGIGFFQRHTARELGKLIHRMNLHNNVCVTSFNLWPMLCLRQDYPNIETGFSYSEASGFVQRLLESRLANKVIGATFTNMSINMFDETTVDRVHRQKTAVGAWTLLPLDSTYAGGHECDQAELDQIKNLAKQDIEYFITDDPLRLSALVNSLKSEKAT